MVLKMRKIQAVLLIAIFILPPLTAGCVTSEYTVSENYTETEYRTEYKTETYNDVETDGNPVCDSEPVSTSTTWYTAYYILNNAFQHVYYFDYEISPQAHDKVSIKLIFPRQLQGEIGIINIYDLTAVGHIEAAPSVGIIDFKSLYTYQEAQKLLQWNSSVNAKVAAAKLLVSQQYQTSASSPGPEIERDVMGAGLVGVVILGPKYFWNTEITARLVYCDTNKGTKTVVKERQVPYQVPVEVVKQREVTKTRLIPFWELLFK